MSLDNNNLASQNKFSKEALNSGLARVIESIIGITSEETSALKNNRPFDISTMNMRKVRLLHDYNTAIKALAPEDLEPSVRSSLKIMRTVLEQNVLQFKAHVAAVQEIVTIVSKAAQDQQNDGTYMAKRAYGT